MLKPSVINSARKLKLRLYWIENWEWRFSIFFILSTTSIKWPIPKIHWSKSIACVLKLRCTVFLCFIELHCQKPIKRTSMSHIVGLTDTFIIINICLIWFNPTPCYCTTALFHQWILSSTKMYYLLRFKWHKGTTQYLRRLASFRNEVTHLGSTVKHIHLQYAQMSLVHWSQKWLRNRGKCKSYPARHYKSWLWAIACKSVTTEPVILYICFRFCFSGQHSV